MSTGIFLWEDPDGTRKWEAYASWDELKPLIAAQLNQGTDPAKMMLSAELNWTFPGTHKGRKTVWMRDILDICNHAVVDAAASASDMPHRRIEFELGWISPEGGFFPCGYGCHAKKAREIVGYLARVDDPCLYLENEGWLAVYRNPSPGKSLAIGMGKTRQRISSQQLQTLQRLGIEGKIENITNFL